MKRFGDYLRELRRERSLRDVQKETGISHTYLSTLEKGYDPRTKKERKPSFEVLKTLSDFYKVDYMTLLVKAGYIEEAERETMESILKVDESIIEEAPPSYDLALISEQIRLGTVFAYNEKKLTSSESTVISRIDKRVGYFLAEECPSIPEKELAGLSGYILDSLEKNLQDYLDSYNERKGKDES